MVDLGTDAPAFDVISDVLARIHLASAIFLRAEFTAPWAFTSADHATLAHVVRPGAKRLVLFHIVVEGECSVELPTGERADARAGDAVVVPYCDVHSMGYPASTTPVPIGKLVPPPPWSEMPILRYGGGGERTQILCGYLDCEDLLFHPLLRALPRLLRVRPASQPAAQWREASLRYALDQAAAGSTTLLARIPELVLADCLRQYFEEMPAEQRSWLGALKDPTLGKALISLHAQPEAPWTVASLAHRVGVSRTVLADRFSQTLGITPMRYLAQWRLQVASHLLRTSGGGLGTVAAQVGYESEAAFSRAFKRHLGVSPAQSEGILTPGSHDNGRRVAPCRVAG